MKFKHIILFFASLFASVSLAELERCREDILINSEDAFGRNAWARKCGYIDSEQEAATNKLGMYWTLRPNIAPKRVSAPCSGAHSTSGICPKGCFTGTQKVLFANRYMPISKAHAAGMESATVLSTGLNPKEAKIWHFVKGKTDENILRFRTAGERTLEVTLNHPMVKGDGLVVRADSLKIGDSLLDENLTADKIIGLETIPYSGMVWNILLEDETREGNLVFSQGLLTGSIRFQNQWADKFYRLSLRKNIDISGL